MEGPREFSTVVDMPLVTDSQICHNLQKWILNGLHFTMYNLISPAKYSFEWKLHWSRGSPSGGDGQ